RGGAQAGVRRDPAGGQAARHREGDAVPPPPRLARERRELRPAPPAPAGAAEPAQAAGGGMLAQAWRSCRTAPESTWETRASVTPSSSPIWRRVRSCPK